MSGLLKFITCGSVDDGKSTLIGHILYDSKLLYADQEKALLLDSKVGSRGGAIDYSLLLARPNIDTGMGLERLACVMQNVGNLFEVDTVQSVLHHVEHIAGKTYKQDPKTDISIRVITDHIRSCTFMVSDGILPSNEGRGYVLRRLLRRAARHGRMLEIGRASCRERVYVLV